jgi:hypothetical protein
MWTLWRVKLSSLLQSVGTIEVAISPSVIEYPFWGFSRRYSTFLFHQGGSKPNEELAVTPFVSLVESGRRSFGMRVLFLKFIALET